MKNFLLRLSVAATFFFLSVSLSNFSKRVGPHLLNELAAPIDSTAAFFDPSSDTFLRSEEEIRSLYRRYGPAKTRRDWTFFERLTTDDYVLSWRGLRITKGQDINMMLGAPEGDSYERDVEFVKVFGDVAVAQGRMEVRSENGYRCSWKFLDTWEKSMGLWRLQNTRLIDE